jgi:hypothetical protein
MTNFTSQNHLSYSIGDGPCYGFRTSPIEKFNVYVGQINKDHYRKSNWREELRRTADSVYKEFGKDLIVYFSGGTDSEIVLRNFLEIGINPKCVVIKFKDDYNLSDVKSAVDLATTLGVKIEIVEFDVVDFYFSGHAKDFGEQIQCTQITYLTIYKNILNLGFPSVMGGECLFYKKIEKDKSYWHYTFRENEDASAMRFSNKFNIPLVNEWFSYTPEMILYFIEHPIMQELLNNNILYKLSSVSTKNQVLKSLYPDIRSKNKTHGFEKLLGLNYEAYKEIGMDQIKRLEKDLDGIEINELVRILKNEN